MVAEKVVFVTKSTVGSVVYIYSLKLQIVYLREVCVLFMRCIVVGSSVSQVTLPHGPSRSSSQAAILLSCRGECSLCHKVCGGLFVVDLILIVTNCRSADCL